MPLFIPHFNLQPLNTLAVPAFADWYVSVTKDTELREALLWARERSLPLLVLGGGSNLVLRDHFAGLVIHLRTQGKTCIAEDDQYVWLQVAAGENWHELVQYCLEQGFYGLENLSLIPGSVGAAPIQNIGAYGVEVCSLVHELTAMDVASGINVTFTRDACRFGYRDSVFKGELKDKYIITQVCFRLSKLPQLQLAYPALQQALANEVPITAQRVSEAVMAIRRSKLPDPAEIPNVGSFFKNPLVSAAQYQQLLARYPDIPAYPQADGQVKLAAAWLIDRAGWRGRKHGNHGARVHSQQALVLTNPQRQGGQAVLDLAAAVAASVLETFAVSLEMEPRIYP